MVTNKGLEKARAYLNQISLELMAVPSKGHKGNYLFSAILIIGSRLSVPG